MYEYNNDNRSCIHLSDAQYFFELKLEEVRVLSHGKLMEFVLLAEDGLNATT